MTEINTSERSLTIQRTFDAPRERVWEAWTEPELVAEWWGPDGFTNTIHEMDVRPGGVWRFVMHGSDGVDYQNEIVYDEVVEPERLVYTHPPNEEHDLGKFRVTVDFDELESGVTALTMRMRFESAAERERQEEFGAIEGANQTLGRLADYLINGDNGGVN